MKDSPRPFFRFAPLVNKEDDNYKKLLEGFDKLSTCKLHCGK